jgi:general secretion pathway protein E
MPDAASLTDRVLDTLVGSGLITVEQRTGALDAASPQKSVGVALVERGLVTPEDIGTVLEDELGVPRVDLSSYAPDDDALALVPASVARGRRILPLFEIEGTLTVAIGDPLDVFALDEVASELGLELDPVLTDAPALLAAIAQYFDIRAEVEVAPSPAAAERVPEETPPPVAPAVAEPAPVVPVEEAPPPPPSVEALAEEPVPEQPVAVAEEAPAVEVTVDEEPATMEAVARADVVAGGAHIDLDVLAVADSRKVAVLVTEILEDAAARGASRVHLLPYKEDFFLVYRIKGRLEKVASAPLSMQSALVEAFKTFSKLGSVPSSAPAVGRVRARLAEQDLVLSVSAVPTIAGQRLVISLAPFRPAPPALAELGMNDAEARALRAMVERGRGILLVCAPVAAGRSTTYYALIAHAAAVGKTVYSVERSVEYEIPAVAQLMVNPASSAGAASYMSAGLRQDTDVIAVDGVQTAEEIHLAVQAAGRGKLVIATFAAGDVVSGVRRMLDLGAEPFSLAAALTLGVGQRLVRTNCPNCTTDRKSALAGRVAGVPSEFVEKTGGGCPNCAKSGFLGVTGVFEVLPFTEPVRATVARGLDAAGLSAAALAAGMRPLATAGIEKVLAGAVSLEELDRVLRLAE